MTQIGIACALPVFMVARSSHTVRKRVKMSRELRLAYLSYILLQRIYDNNKVKTAWTRRYKLIVELDRERVWRPVKCLSL